MAGIPGPTCDKKESNQEKTVQQVYRNRIFAWWMIM